MKSPYFPRRSPGNTRSIRFLSPQIIFNARATTQNCPAIRRAIRSPGYRCLVLVRSDRCGMNTLIFSSSASYETFARREPSQPPCVHITPLYIRNIVNWRRLHRSSNRPPVIANSAGWKKFRGPLMSEDARELTASRYILAASPRRKLIISRRNHHPRSYTRRSPFF